MWTGVCAYVLEVVSKGSVSPLLDILAEVFPLVTWGFSHFHCIRDFLEAIPSTGVFAIIHYDIFILYYDPLTSPHT